MRIIRNVLILVALTGSTGCFIGPTPVPEDRVCTGFRDGVKPPGFDSMTWKQQAPYIVTVPCE